MLLLQFQGGFSARTLRVSLLDSDGTTAGEQLFHPEDSNSCQEFPFRVDTVCTEMRVVFEDFCDFFGRIVVYSLDVRGVCRSDSSQ